MHNENYSFTNYKSSEFIWDGPNIACIKLCHGDKVSDVVYKLGLKVCDLLKQFDELEDVDLECIIDKCDKNLCLEDRSLMNMFKLLQANDCSIKKLIDDTVDLINEKKNVVFNLDLGCLKTCPDYSQSRYDFICADGGNAGDTLSVTYKTAFDPTPITITLKQKECIRFEKPLYTVTLLSFTSPTVGMYAEVRQSVGFANCTDCVTATIIDNSLPGCYKNLDFTITQILQYLIHRLCCQDATLTTAETQLSLFEQQYTDIVNSYSTYKEPKVTSCLNTTPILHSLLTARLDPYLCSLRANLGTHTQVLNSIATGCNAKWESTNYPAVLCSPMSALLRSVDYIVIDGVTYNINTVIGSGQVSQAVAAINAALPTSLAQFSVLPSGQIGYSNIANTITLFMTNCDGVTTFAVNFNSSYLSATNLAQDNFNQWSVICDIIGRLKARENSACCLPSCKDIKLGYKLIYDGESNVYTITFNSAYGTSIPDGWTDTGSILQVTDSKGVVSSFELEITNDYSFDIDLSGLDTTKIISLSIRSVFVHTSGLTCSECLSDFLPAVPSDCSFCRVCATASNDTDLIKVLYKTADNSTIRSQTLSSGACITFKMPDENPTIVASYALTTGSDISIGQDPTTDCNEDMVFPDVSENTCWFFRIPISSAFNAYVERLVTSVTQPTTVLDIDMKGNQTDNYTYDSLTTSLNPSLTLNGPTIAAAGFIKGTLALPVSEDILTVVPVVPSSLTQPILTAKACSNYEIRHNGDLNIAGSVATLITILNHKQITFGYTEGPTPFGIVLEISGQDISNTPQLNLKDPITGTIVSVKGELLEDTCDCQ